MVRERRTDTALHPAVLELIPRLARGLALLGDLEHLIIETGHHNRYLQFAAWDGGLRAETVGNAYLEPDDCMACEDWDWLVANGWNPEDDGGNLWREWIPAQPEAAATVTAVTLAEIHAFDDIRRLRFITENDTVLAAITSGL